MAMFLSAIIIPGLQLCACSAPAGTLWGTQAGDCIKYIKGQRQSLWSLVFGESHLTTFPNPKDQIQFRQNLSQRNPMELSHFTNMLTHRQEWPPKVFLWPIVKREREYSNISKTDPIHYVSISTIAQINKQPIVQQQKRYLLLMICLVVILINQL